MVFKPLKAERDWFDLIQHLLHVHSQQFVHSYRKERGNKT